jgi:Bacterial regulatory protein, Fis family
MINFPYTPGITIELAEKWVILKAMEFYKGNKTQVASAVGCAIRTLDSKLEKYADEERDRKDRERRQTETDAEFLQRSRGLSGANARLRLEPTTNVSKEQSVSVPERQEVQTVLPGKASKGGKERHR